MHVDAILFKSTLQDFVVPRFESSFCQQVPSKYSINIIRSGQSYVQLCNNDHHHDLKFRLQRTSGALSKVAGFGNEFCKFFQVLLVFLVKAVLDSTINVNNGDNLDGERRSAS